MSSQQPSDRMRALGVLQAGDPLLARPTAPFALPEEADEARTVVHRLHAAMDAIARVHDFSGKGMGLAAPQIGIPRSAAVVRPAGGSRPVVLLNPRITAASEEIDDQYEGCLSFFDVRGLVPRPLHLTVVAADPDGTTTTTTYARGLARLLHHEIDHLAGVLYERRMRPGTTPISVAEYRGTGRAWAYEGP